MFLTLFQLSTSALVMEATRFSSVQSFPFFFAVALALCFSQFSSATNETDKLALLAFKAGIIGDPFGALNSWTNTTDFCKWNGVTCSRRHHQRVTVLDLNSKKLYGSMSPHIGNLSFLRRLSLYNNSFDHEIPPQIGQLHRLRILQLPNNLLAGNIPNISGCFNLAFLNLGYNQLVGEIPPQLGTLSNLQVLCLSENNLEGRIPSSIGNLSSLEILFLAANNLGGSIPQALAQLGRLEKLNLGVNGLFGIVPLSVFNFSSLVLFSIVENQIHGNLPADIGFTLPNLEHFGIGSNRFVGPIPHSISNATNLQVLDMGSNGLSGNVPSLENLYDLQWCSFALNHLGSGKSGDLGFLCSLTHATNLRVLTIGNNGFAGFLPECIGNFSTTLTQLRAHANLIFGKIPTMIANLVNLEGLVMHENKLSGTIPSDLGNLQNLVALILYHNDLSGEIPSSLHNLTRLNYLYLHKNNFQGLIPSYLYLFQSLIHLNLCNNNLRGSMIQPIPSLVVLDLSHNRMTGALPMEVGNMQHLIYLDISGNMLEGEIPNSLGNCFGLEVLIMRENLFQGSIPQSLSSLRDIQVLDLSYNNLTGEIPKFLAFDKLEILDLSHNNLEGPLPTDGVFKNESATFIIGNSKLCGGMPKFQLPKCQFESSKSKGGVHKLRLSISIISGLLGVALLLAFMYLLCLKKERKEPFSSSIDDSWLNLSYGALLKATENFSLNNLIGDGSFGSVYKGILQNGTIVAVKVLNLMRHGALNSFIAECEALKLIRHRNLLKVLTTCSSIDYNGNDFKALVYEFMVNGSLQEWLHPSSVTINANNILKMLSFIQRMKISIDIASALDYLHHQSHDPIIHCDLKPSNVLLDAEMVAHVGDFGLAKILLGSTSNATSRMSSVGLRGTIGYAAPEYGVGGKVSREGDVYSFGIVLLEMFTGVSPTSDMFIDNLNLHNFVAEALPDRVLAITDPIVFQGRKTPTHLAPNSNNTIRECLVMIYGIGIACSVELPRERMSITEVTAQLHLIRDRIYAGGFHG